MCHRVSPDVVYVVTQPLCTTHSMRRVLGENTPDCVVSCTLLLPLLLHSTVYQHARNVQALGTVLVCIPGVLKVLR
jgi:hypothetical protein